MAAQNRRRSLRPATGGRPGDNNGGRPDRAERRFRLAIATSCLKVLRRPIEFTLAASIGMKDQTVRRPSTEPGHAQCVDNQLPGHAVAHREPDHLTA
jgi:hypothetical protein